MDTSLINECLDKGLISPRVLLSGVKLLSEDSAQAPEFLDRRNLPFWFHLGKELQVGRAFQIGPRLGLVAACFLQSCPVAEWMCLGGNHRFVTSNIALKSTPTRVEFYKQSETHAKNYDFALLTESYDYDTAKKFLEFAWSGLNQEGLLAVDYIDNETQGKAFDEFCRVKNREPVKFKTRYGVGILER